MIDDTEHLRDIIAEHEKRGEEAPHITRVAPAMLREAKERP